MRNHKFLTFSAALVVIAAVGYLFGSNVFRNYSVSPSGEREVKKIRVTASFYPLYFFSSEIGGARAEVLNLTPSGVEPHDYEPTAADIARIERSDLLILNGGLEAWAGKIRENLKDTKVEMVIAGEGLFRVGKDPHVWLAPSLAEKEVRAILAGFLKVDPVNKDAYEANANKLLAGLDQLDELYRQKLSACRQKYFVAAHAAFGYLAAAYGLNQVTIAGISPEEEPSPRRLAEIADFAKKHGIKYIFFEKLVTPKLSQTIADEIGAETLVLDPLEGLTTADLKKGKNYFTVMVENLENLRTALSCDR